MHFTSKGLPLWKDFLTQKMLAGRFFFSFVLFLSWYLPGKYEKQICFVKGKGGITYMRPKPQESEPLTASVHFNGHLSIMVQLWFHGQTDSSVCG